MAKKDKKKKDTKKGSGATDPVEAVRSAVERTLKATSEGTGTAGKRGRDLVDEVAHAAARFRDAMADLKVLDDLKREVESLRARVAALEGKAATTARSRTTASRSTASRSAAAKSTGTTRARSAASKSAAKPASSTRARSTSTRAKSTGTRSTGTRSTRSASSRSPRRSSSS
jgi:DNA topoisomerase I